MKAKAFPLLATVGLMALALKGFAQQMPDMTSDGQAKIIIEKKGANPETYQFSGAFPSGLKCIEHTGATPADNYTDIMLIQSFDNSDGSQTLVNVTMRFWPNSSGTFQLPINGDLVKEGHITLDIERGNSRTILLDASPEKGTRGTLTIQDYPLHLGNKIKGVFDATLMDNNDELIHVSGSFNVKRKKE